MTIRRRLAAVPLLAASALVFAACGNSDSDETGTAADTIQIEDNNGTLTVPADPKSVVALDNRTFETLADWDVPLSAAAVSLMPGTIAYTSDDNIVDIGNHNEPNLELIVAAEPDLIINGQRFTQHGEKISQLVPDAALVQLDPRDGEPFDTELKRQVTVLGEIFGKKDEAAALTADLDAAIARVKAAYNAEQTVMAVTTSGGEIGYIAPIVGRTLGPVFDFLSLTPALQVEDATDNHQGDDISVEAIAKSNPDWILVMDRDAAVAANDENYSPAADILENSEALKSVTAVKEAQIVYMPADTYTNEGIQTYTEFLNAFAAALEAAAK